MVTLSDNSTVFAWHYYNYTPYTYYTKVKRMSATGTMMWEVTMEDDAVHHSYPYLVDAGNNEVILVYAKGDNDEVMVKKIDASGAPVWAEDVLVYNGGFGWGGPSLDVISDENGGVFLTWDDDRNFDDCNPAFLSHVLADGSYGLSAGVGGLQLAYNGDEGMRANSPKVLYDKESNFVYVTWIEFNFAQIWQRIIGQKVSLSGELLWGAQGVEVAPLEDRALAYHSAQLGDDNNFAVFYMVFVSYTDQPGFATLIDGKDGAQLWENHTQVSSVYSWKSNLGSTPLIDGKYWLTHWYDSRNETPQIYAQRIFLDGGFEAPETPEVSGCSIISCPEDIRITVPQGVTSSIVEYEIDFQCETGEDLVVLELAQGKESGESFPVGTTTVMYLLTHENEILDICSFDVTIEQLNSIIDADESKFNIYPNPTTGQVRIESAQKSINNIKVFDVLGSVVLEIENINATEINIDLSNFANGLYFIKANNQTIKVIKQ